MSIVNFVREFRDQYAVAHPIMKAAFTALYTGTTAAYVGWSTLPTATVLDTTTMAILAMIIGASAHIAAWCLGRIADVTQVNGVVVGVEREEHMVALDMAAHAD